MVQQDYRLLKSMEQEGEKLSNKLKEKDSVISSTNPQGGMHQQGGATSSSTIQGGEQDQPMPENSTRSDQPMSEAVQKTSAYRTASGAPESSTKQDQQDTLTCSKYV